MTTFHCATKVRARKPHRCYCCRGPIPKGDKYVREAGVYEGDFYSLKMHEGCSDLATRVSDEEGWEYFAQDEVWPTAEGLGWVSIIPRRTNVR